ncbi:hypothetical protein [Burkholderia multivorans]|uniref:hypothetical protein n=1 Tax=Burkholderia multivorans TaxID=87883 RepID=UPI0011B244CE|nr:hypothetical protein [Burkholderia multivorans]
MDTPYKNQEAANSNSDIIRIKILIDKLFTGSSLKELEAILVRYGLNTTQEIDTAKQNLYGRILLKMKQKQVESEIEKSQSESTNIKSEAIRDNAEGAQLDLTIKFLPVSRPPGMAMFDITFAELSQIVLRQKLQEARITKALRINYEKSLSTRPAELIALDKALTDGYRQHKQNSSAQAKIKPLSRVEKLQAILDEPSSTESRHITATKGPGIK